MPARGALAHRGFPPATRKNEGKVFIREFDSLFTEEQEEE